MKAVMLLPKKTKYTRPGISLSLRCYVGGCEPIQAGGEELSKMWSRFKPHLL